VYLWKSSSLHKGCETISRDSVRVGSIRQKQPHEFEVHRWDEVDFRPKEVAFIRVGTSFEKDPGNLRI